MTIYNQRDPQWRDKKLGTSSSTIGGFGCAIASLSMLLEAVGVPTKPDQLNDWLKANKGYSGGNLVVWSAIDRYSNQKVTFEKNALRSTVFPCLAEVDMVPSTSEHNQHFVLALSDQECLDPWDGRRKTFASSYGKVKSYRIYKLPPKEDNVAKTYSQAEFDVERNERNKNWTLYQSTLELLGKSQSIIEDLKRQGEIVLRNAENKSNSDAAVIAQLKIEMITANTQPLTALQAFTLFLKLAVAGKWN